MILFLSLSFFFLLRTVSPCMSRLFISAAPRLLGFGEAVLSGSLSSPWLCLSPPGLLVLSVSQVSFPLSKYFLPFLYQQGRPYYESPRLYCLSIYHTLHINSKQVLSIFTLEKHKVCVLCVLLMDTNRLFSEQTF